MTNYIKSLFVKSTLLKSFSILFAGTLSSQLIPILFTPILSRLYSPSSFGTLAVFTSIVGLLSMFYTLKFEMAFILSKNKLEANNLLSLSFYILKIAFVLSLVLFLVFYYLFAFDSIFLLLPFATLVFSILLVLERYYNCQNEYSTMSAMKIQRTVGETMYNLLGHLSIFFKNNLIFGFIIGHIVSLAIRFRKNESLIPLLTRKSLDGDAKNLFSKYVNFPKFTLIHSLFNSVSSNLPIFLIPLLFGQEFLGLYAFGMRLVQSPLIILSATLNNVLGQYYASNQEKFKASIQIQKKWYWVLLFLIVCTLPISMYLPNIFGWVFGNEWYRAGEIILFLLPSIIIGFFVSSLSFIPLVLQRQKQAFYMEIIYTIVKIIPFGLSWYFDYSFNMLIIVYSLLTSVYLLFSMGWIYYLTKSTKPYDSEARLGI